MIKEVILDSNLKKIVKNNPYIIISGKEISKFDYSNVECVKNKNLFFVPSTINNINVRKFNISMNGYVVYISIEKQHDLYGMVRSIKYRIVLNSICLKSKTQKNIDRFDYEHLDNFYILFIPENKKEFAKMKLLQLDIDMENIDE